MRRLWKWWRSGPEHTYVYSGRSGSGWAVVRCADQGCDYEDIT